MPHKTLYSLRNNRTQKESPDNAMPTTKMEILSKITVSGLVCVIRAENPDQAAHIADALALAGEVHGCPCPRGGGRGLGTRASSGSLYADRCLDSSALRTTIVSCDGR